MIRAIVTALAIQLCAGLAQAADAPLPGKALFARYCTECHGAGPHRPGTERLAAIRGSSHALLEERTDLTAAYVRLVVRQGLIEMPPWRQTEIDDAALDQIVAYLVRAR